MRIGKVAVSRKRRLVSARVGWDRRLLRAKGRDRFAVSLVAYPVAGGPDSTVLVSQVTLRSVSAVSQFRAKLSKPQWKTLVSAADVVISASQLHASGKGRKAVLNRGYVNTQHLKKTRFRAGGDSLYRSVGRAGKACDKTLIKPGADLSGCDFTGVDIAGADLTGVNLSGANLAGANLAGADLSGVIGTGTGGTGGTGTCSSGGPCAVGDNGPGGGTVFYAELIPNTWGQYLEAAPTDWDGVVDAVDPYLSWGPGSTAGECGNSTIATGTAIGAGGANTVAITSATQCDTPAEAPAAWAAKNYVGGGQTDWSLPSKAELNALYASKDTVGGLGSLNYWSSSSSNAREAWYQGFITGSQYADVKPNSFLVRPIRAFGPKQAVFSVTFDANGGTGSMAVQVTNVATALNANMFTRVGYEFVGWNTVAGGGGTAYANSASYPFAASVTLYAQWSLKCAYGGVCVVGDIGPGGGKVFYVDTSRSAESQYWEAAPNDIGSMNWAPVAGTCHSIATAQDAAIGAGKTNTAAIIANTNCDNATKAPAAWAAHDYSSNGLSDWFLPSTAELNQLCRYAWTGTTDPTVTDSCETVVPTAGTPPVANGRFSSVQYWSSSASSYDDNSGTKYVYIWSFQNGLEFDRAKHANDSVRPIRTFGPVGP